jgi:hypothetical protein
MMLGLVNSANTDQNDDSAGHSGPVQPAPPPRSHWNDDLLLTLGCGTRKAHHLPAVGAGGEVDEQAFTLARGYCAFLERGQQIRIRVRTGGLPEVFQRYLHRLWQWFHHGLESSPL